MGYLRDRLRNRVGLTAAEGQRVYDNLLGTREMLGVFSMFYNGQTLLGAGLARALSRGDRAEAWYEIRYGWKNDDLNNNRGWAKRHYMESAVFGLYDNSGSVNLDEAQDAFRMLQLHRSRILERERLYGTAPNDMVSAGNDEPRYAALLADPQIGTTIPALAQALDAAKFVLLAKLRQDNPDLADLDVTAHLSTAIYLDPNRDDASQTLNPNHTSFLSARTYDRNGLELASRDILTGEGGLDILDGGKGDDILLGGTGFDVYRYTTGDGNDRIIDEDRLGVLLIDGSDAGGLYTRQDENEIWTNTVTNRTLTHGSTWKLTLADGSSLDLGSTLDDGDFGLRRLTLPTPPLTTRNILGDLAPVDFEPEPGLQTHVDDLGNLVTDPDQAEPGRSDTFYDSAGNDRLQGREGRDLLSAERGGNDALEGGAGADILYAGDGNDWLYGDDTISIADALAAGRVQSGSGQQGDWLNGGTGDDVLLAGAADDVLCGGIGDDILVGGAGDDVLNGDDDFTATSFDWSVSYIGNRFDRRYTPIQNRNQFSFLGGKDILYGGNGNDVLFGLDGDDLLYGEADDDVMSGDDGNDRLYGGTGDDIMTGDYGKLAYDSGAGAVVQGNDLLDGGDGNDWLQGEAGDDVLLGGKDNDTLYQNQRGQAHN